MTSSEIERLEAILAQLQVRAAELQTAGTCQASELVTLRSECLRLWGVIEAYRLGRTEVVGEVGRYLH
jgi:hypothetical protein